MSISGKVLCKWLQPSPIVEFFGEYELEILPLGKVLTFKNPNKLPNIGRVSFKALAKMFLEGTLVGLNEHYLKMLISDWVPIGKAFSIIATRDKTVWDGSHRLTALAIVKEKKIKMRLTHIAVFFKKE